MVRNLIWDFDGTVIDSIRMMATSVAAYTAGRGHAVDVDTVYRMRKKGEENWRSYCKEIAASLNMSVDEFRESYMTHVLQRDKESAPFPVVFDVCSWIVDQGGSNHVISLSTRERVIDHLERLKRRDLFGEIIDGHGELPPKPDPAAFRYVIKQHGLRTDETMAIGDQASDICAAREASLSTCYFDPDGLKHTSADIVIDSYSQLLRFLSRSS